MKAFLFSIVAMVVISVAAALILDHFEATSAATYQSERGSVRL